MEREELRDLPFDHAWTPETLQDTFAAVMGGVAYPGRRPGFAVVAGLCHPKAEGDCEIHVLAETESLDLGELLRACHALGAKWRLPDTRLPATRRPESFRWIGNGKHVGAQEIIWRLNREPGNEYNRLDVEYTTILDDPTPYLTMFSLLSDLTHPDRKRLYLHGSKAAHAMNEVPRDEVAETKLGEYPSIEAMAFVVVGLREQAEHIIHAREWAGRDTNPYKNWARFSQRGKR